MPVYFIRSGNYIKIGYADSPRRRLKELQTGNPEKLDLMGTVPGGTARERELHELFCDFHVKGEWFQLVTDILAYLTAQGTLAKPKKSTSTQKKAPAPTGSRQKRNGRYKKDGPGWIEYAKSGKNYYARERWWDKTADGWKKKAKYRADLPVLTPEQYEAWRQGKLTVEELVSAASPAEPG